MKWSVFFLQGITKNLLSTLKNLAKEKVTYDYPEKGVPLPNRFRGIHKFYPEKCNGCNRCVDICPLNCIRMSAKPHPDETKKGKIVESFELDFERCMLCDLCTETCATGAITMTLNFELAAYNRDDFSKDLIWLDENDEQIRKER